MSERYIRYLADPENDKGLREFDEILNFYLNNDL